MSVDYPSTRGILRVSRHEAHTCVKRPNRARTSIQLKYKFYTKGNLFTIVFNYNSHKTGSLAQNFTKIQDKASLAVFFASKAPDASHPQVRLRYLKNIFPRQGEQCPVVEFPYLGYSPPKCNAMAHQTFNKC